MQNKMMQYPKQTHRTVNDLQFNVAQLLKEATGAVRTYDIHNTSFKHLNDEVEVVAPLVGQIQFLRTGQDILASGVLETVIQKQCGRCLSPFMAPIAVEIEEVFYPTIDLVNGTPLPPPPDADEANRIDEKHTLDLHEIVRQDIFLETVTIRYCRPDCKGLCPYCGQDLNVASCDCDVAVIDPRWANLLALQLEE